MSDIGLYSGLYDTIRRWADLIDDVLVGLKSGADLSGYSSFDDLKKLLSSLSSGDVEDVDFSDQRVAAMIEYKLGNRVEWTRLRDNLSGQTSNATTISVLEDIAQCLAEQHADTIAKMRWGGS